VKPSEPAQRGSGQDPTDTALLATPLEFISADHLRERQICAIIDGLAADTSSDRHAALTVLRFLNEELNVHMQDEAEDLFPLLARRCPAEDDIDRVIIRICTDLNEATALLPPVRTILARCLDTGGDLAAAERKMLIRFAGHVRRHLAAENAILLPIARARLTRRDLQSLSRHMRRRRGLPPDGVGARCCVI
jgi:hemerythrin-like domain-containing protein